MIDDRKIIEQCLKGSQQAFAMLVDRYKSLVCALAYCAVGNRDTSEDIAQDVFIAVWKGLASLKNHDKFRPWLVSMTRNITNHHIRKECTSPKTFSIDMEEGNWASKSCEEPSEAAIKGEENTMLWETLEAMPLEYRETLVLYYRYEKSTKQVAALLAISPEVVRQRLVRGREMLRSRIEGMLEKNIKAIEPGKKFTASVIAAISGIPISLTITESSVSAAVAQSPWAAAVSAVFSAAAVKIAAILITAAAITAGIILTRHTASEPIVPMAKQTRVETHGNTTDLAATPNPEPAINTPDPVETHGSASPTPDAPAQPEGFTPRGVLSGLITDIKTGEPVIDAQLQLQLSSNYINAETDEHGFYYFDEDKVISYGKGSLTISSIEYVGIGRAYNNSLNLNITKGTQAVQHIQLEKACMLNIEVVDDNGEPISKVDATITDTASTSSYPERVNTAYAVTDKNGKMTTGGIKPSLTPYVVTLIHTNHEQIDSKSWVSKSDYAPAYQILTMNDPEVIESIKIVMKKGIDIKGRLVYSNGLPAKDVKIGLTPQWWHCSDNYPKTRINEDGTFTIKHVEPGIHDIIVSVPTGSESFSLEKLSTESIEEDKYLDLMLPYESPSNLVTFTGRIIIEGDCDISIIFISIRNSDNFFSQPIKLEDNTKEVDFKIDNIQPGNYTIKFIDDNIKQNSLQNVQIPSAGFECTLQCKDIINISGTVVEQESQKPITNFRVFHRVIKSYDMTYTPDNSWVNHPNANDGRFEFVLRNQGVHQFIIDSDGYAPQTIELDTLKSTSFTAQLTKGVTLAGKVLDSAGRAIQNAKIIPFSKNAAYQRTGGRAKIFATEIGSILSDENGNFVLDKLPAGTETIKISHPDYCEKIIDVDLTQGTDNITITLNAGCTVEGYVYDNSGNPRANFPFIAINVTQNYFLEDDADAIKTTTDKDGYYKFSNLSEKCWCITHPNTSTVQGACRNCILPAENQPTRLDFGGTYFFTGRIFMNGSPLANADITVIDAEFNQKNFINNANTLSDGSFIFSGIPEGASRLVYENPELQNDLIYITDFDTKGKDLNIGDLYINNVDVEITIEGGENIEIDHCGLTEDFGSFAKIGRPLTSTDRGIFKVTNVREGKHKLYIQRSKDWASWKYDIEVLSTDKLFTTKIKLPIMTSSVYGKLPSDDIGVSFVNDEDHFTISPRNSSENGIYKIENIPAGKYIVKNYGYAAPVTIFELQEGESLELDLDKFGISKETLITAGIIIIDGTTMRQIEGGNMWLETGGLKYNDVANGNIQAPAGTYTLCINRPGYKDYRTDITLLAGDKSGNEKRQSITAILERQ